MDEKIRKVFKGFLELTDAEKQEFNKAVKHYEESPYAQKRGIEKSVITSKKLDSFEIEQPCPCCGK